MVVVNTPYDRDLNWQFEREWLLGGAGDDRLAVSQLAPHEVAADSLGRVYVLDTNDHRVLVISGTGTIADTLGRFGSGPGELQLPAALSIDTAGNVVVYDRAKAGLVRWSPEGVPLGEIRIAAQSLGPAIAATAAGVLFTGFEPERPGPDHQRLVVWSDSSERGLARIARLPYRRADFPACGLRGITISPLSSPELVWHAERLSA